ISPISSTPGTAATGAGEDRLDGAAAMSSAGPTAVLDLAGEPQEAEYSRQKRRVQRPAAAEDMEHWRCSTLPCPLPALPRMRGRVGGRGRTAWAKAQARVRSLRASRCAFAHPRSHENLDEQVRTGRRMS